MGFSKNENGTGLVDNRTGVVYEHSFDFDGGTWWFTVEALSSGFARTTDGKLVRLGVEKGVLKKARWAKEGETAPAGKAEGLAVLVTADMMEEPPAPKLFLHFESRTYELDAVSVAQSKTLLPDGRVLSLVPDMRRGDDSVMPAAILIDETTCEGRATLIDDRTKAGDGAALVVRPVQAADLAELYHGTDALTDEAIDDAPIVNHPLFFAVLGTEKPEHITTLQADYMTRGQEPPRLQSGQTLLLHRTRGIPLQHFEFPAWFGQQDKKRKPRPRYGIFLLATAPVVVSTRDAKRIVAPAGTIVIVDLKADLRPIVRYLPVFEGNPYEASSKMTRANEIVIDPKGKVSFQLTEEDGSTTPAQTWRVGLRWLGGFANPGALEKIHGMWLQCPALPTRPEDDLVEAAAEAMN